MRETAKDRAFSTLMYLDIAQGVMHPPGQAPLCFRWVTAREVAQEAGEMYGTAVRDPLEDLARRGFVHRFLASRANPRLFGYFLTRRGRTLAQLYQTALWIEMDLEDQVASRALPPMTRCESRHREGGRTWRCSRPDGHKGYHVSTGGGRRWIQRRREFAGTTA